MTPLQFARMFALTAALVVSAAPATADLPPPPTPEAVPEVAPEAAPPPAPEAPPAAAPATPSAAENSAPQPEAAKEDEKGNTNFAFWIAIFAAMIAIFAGVSGKLPSKSE